MKQSYEQECSVSIIVIMGATGTGKSTFINLLTNDDSIRIGHKQQSETFGVQSTHYIDQDTGRSAMLIDTPGFDDSREGVTDTDILEKIVQFLEPKNGESINVNGIIYMHRISDPRVGGISRKNIKIFHALCGEANLGNVRIVTTNWSRVSEEEGNHREADLKSGAFKALIDAGAPMRRHANTPESARRIMSELIPLEAVTMKIQEEVRDGKKLADTAAGKVIAADMLEMQKKNERELADLKREMDDAEESNNRALRTELEQERKALEEKMERANADRKRLEATLNAARVGLVREQGRSVESTQLRGKNKEVSEVSTALQARYKDSVRPEREPAEQLSKRSEPRRRTTADSNPDLDMTERDETAQIQLLIEELDRGRQERLQLVEKNRVRSRASQEDEVHLEQMEAHLRGLEARIRAAERKKSASVGRKVLEGLYYVAHKVMW